MFRANVIKKPWFLLLADQKNATSVLKIWAESAAAAKSVFESQDDGDSDRLRVIDVAANPNDLLRKTKPDRIEG